MRRHSIFKIELFVETSNESSSMLTIFGHWCEMKARCLHLLVSFGLTLIVSYLHSEVIMYACTLPFLEKFEGKKFIFTNLLEGFSSCLLISGNFSFAFTLVLAVNTVFSFLTPGLHKKEFYVLRLVLKLSGANLFGAFLFVYFLILPSLVKFFGYFEFSKLFELSLEAKISDYLNLISKCFFWVSLSFQSPLLILMFLYSNVVSLASVLTKRKEFIVFFCILGALLSPPDAWTQMLIAFSFWALTEATLLFFILTDEYVLAQQTTEDQFGTRTRCGQF